MKTNGNATYWGQNILDDADDETKQLPELDLKLSIGGTNSEETEATGQALAIIHDPAMRGLIAR